MTITCTKNASIREFLLFFSFLLPVVHLWAQLPENFNDQAVSAGWTEATGLTFDDRGRMFVWEKRGMVHIVEHGNRLPEPLIDISEEVGNWRDHGLLGFTLHPNFLNNGYIYLLYAVDRHHLLYYGTDQYDPNSSVAFQASIGRLTRYTADPASDFTQIIPESRKVLIGETKDTGFPLLHESHGMGSVIFGEDGTLLVSCGDAASYLEVDVGMGRDTGTYAVQALNDGILAAEENIGAFRSQSLLSLNGKILRINPLTGDGISSNPFYDPKNPRSPASRTWALGFRNPFRMTIRPETGAHTPEAGNPGTIFVGDVGWAAWEELNVVDSPGMNFGWPMYEGIQSNWAYLSRPVPNYAAPITEISDLNCEQEFFHFQDLFWQLRQGESPTYPHPCDETMEVTAENPRFVHAPPIVSWSNQWIETFGAYIPAFDSTGHLNGKLIGNPDTPVKGRPFGGGSSIAGTFYKGEKFPEEYQNSYFHADFASYWIKRFSFDQSDNLTEIADLHTKTLDIVHLEMNKEDECLYYVFYPSRIRKICYGGNIPPTAVIETDQNFGPSPLTIQFSAAASINPNGDSLSYSWEFGDGATSTLPNPSHTFEGNGNEPVGYEVKLIVEDSQGDSSITTRIISLNNTPPKVNITSIKDSSYYGMTESYDLPLEAAVSDLEHDTSELRYEWQTFLHHNTHYHPEPIDENPVSSTFITPVGCGTEVYWYRYRLTVTDPAGLSTTDERILFPDCGPPAAIFEEFTTESGRASVSLNWQTSQEVKNEVFEIQRALKEDGAFETLATIPASGDSQQLQEYIHQDENPVHGLNIYRLRSINEYGSFVFSSEKQVIFPEGNFVQLYPNPAESQIQVQFYPIESTPTTFSLISPLGQKRYQQTWIPQKNRLLKVDVSDFLPGLYIYEVRSGSRQETGKLLIKE